MIKTTDRPNMSSAVYCECYRKNQTNKAILEIKIKDKEALFNVAYHFFTDNISS